MGGGHAGSHDTFVQGPVSRDELEPTGSCRDAGLTPLAVSPPVGGGPRGPVRRHLLAVLTALPPSKAFSCPSIPVGTDAWGSLPGSLSHRCEAVRLTVQSRGSLVPRPPNRQAPRGQQLWLGRECVHYSGA